eukprot:scpid87848/ scgid12758/ 
MFSESKVFHMTDYCGSLAWHARLCHAPCLAVADQPSHSLLDFATRLVASTVQGSIGMVQQSPEVTFQQPWTGVVGAWGWSLPLATCSEPRQLARALPSSRTADCNGMRQVRIRISTHRSADTGLDPTKDSTNRV